VVEDHSHDPPAPDFAESAKLADVALQPSLVQAGLEVIPREGRMLDEDLLERYAAPNPGSSDGRVRIEVLGRNGPEPGVLLQDLVGAAAVAHPETAQGLRPRERGRDRHSRLLFAVSRAAGHEHMFAGGPDVSDWGERT
jgi:hypothetical protein